MPCALLWPLWVIKFDIAHQVFPLLTTLGHHALLTSTLELKAQIAQKKKEIANLFSEMRQYEYRLHAVLVHDGRAGSGHYWYDLGVECHCA